MADETTLTINKAFAVKYKKKKEAEELSRLRDLHGDVGVVSSDSSSSESEDEEGAWSPQTEADFLRTLSLLKNKDPRVYDNNTTFYSTEEHAKSQMDDQRSKSVYLKDYERERLLERGSKAQLSDSDGSDEEGIPPALGPTYQEEQDDLKQQFRLAASEMDKPVLSIRVKTNKEKAQEEKDYQEWLRANEGSKDLEPLRMFWGNPQLDDGEQFLRDYILGHGHRDNTNISVPTYEDVVGVASEKSDDGSDTEDEEALEVQEDFEKRFNFRFEEPDADLIKSYPRTIASSVRTVDDSRKQARQLRLERKKQEREQEKEELKRLKNLKRKEIEQRLKQLAEITGNSVESLGSITGNLDEDFDPESYDQSMEALFGNEYYEGEEEGKPLVMDDDLIDLDPWGEEPHCDDPHFNMDADYESSNQTIATTSRSKRKKQTRPTFDPNKHTFDEYVSGIEPLVKEGGFKYRSVLPNDFGLSAEEILSCDNRELNSWVSLSKTVQYRGEEEERKDKRMFQKRGRNWKRKRQCLNSLYSEPDETSETDEKKSKNSRNSKGSKSKKPKTKLSEARLKSYGMQ